MSNLHPKVTEFKSFIKKHPNLIKHVRNNRESWQPYYEKWVLYGEEDEYWTQFKSDEEIKGEKKAKTSNQELLNKLYGMVNNLDLNKLQEQMNQVSGVITNVQSILQQFQQNKQQSFFKRPNHNRPNPFKFGKD